MMWTITIQGEPVPKGRPRVYRGRAVTPKRTRDYERRVALEARSAGLPRFDRAATLDVQIVGIWSRPLRLQRVRESDDRIPKATRPDVDNLAKAILDGLGAHFDDAQVVRLSVAKFYADRQEGPGVSVSIAIAEE